MLRFTEKTNNFLDNYIGNMSLSLATGIINRFGGEKDFIEQHSSACLVISDGIEGWQQTVDLIRFYEDNKESVLAHAASEAKRFGFDNLVDMIAGFKSLEGERTAEEINDAIQSTEAEYYEQVAVALAWFAGETLSKYYDLFLDELALAHAHLIAGVDSDITLPEMYSNY